MKIKSSSSLINGLVSKIISKLIFKKLGLKPEFKINEIEVETINNKIHFHVNVDGELDERSLLKITRVIDS